MCLEDVHDPRQVAERDITVYKFAIQKSEGVLIAPYQETVYADFGKAMYGTLGRPNQRFEVNVGYHSFFRLTDAKREAEYMESTDGRYARKYVLVKCCIPKGSEYYSGRFDTAVSYASDKLVLVKTMNKLQSWWQRRKEANASCVLMP